VRGLALAAALGFLWANRAGCCWLAAHEPYTVRPAPAAAWEPAPPSAPAVRALVFADFGDDTCQQAAVARGLAAAHSRAPFDLALSPGDNLYDCGPDLRLPGAAACDFAPDGASVKAGYAPPDDPRFRERFERALEPLASGARPLPIYLALGNHDVAGWRSCLEGDFSPEQAGRIRACLEVAHRGPAWRMPGRHYVLDQGPARFVVVDSNVLVQDYGGFTLEQEEAFVREATRGCDARPCFVVGHHPPASAGDHVDGLRPGAPFAERTRRLEEAMSAPVAAWLAGHDHDLQHVRAARGYDVFVSGNGSRWRKERFEAVGPPQARLLFASTAWGWAVLEVSAARWSVRFEDQDGRPLHCCRAEFPGPCQPVACGPGPSAPAVR
jgi:3',5'-cyclic AMP phosphodiesterase CpdA